MRVFWEDGSRSDNLLSMGGVAIKALYYICIHTRIIIYIFVKQLAKAQLGWYLSSSSSSSSSSVEMIGYYKSQGVFSSLSSIEETQKSSSEGRRI